MYQIDFSKGTRTSNEIYLVLKIMVVEIERIIEEGRVIITTIIVITRVIINKINDQ